MISRGAERALNEAKRIRLASRDDDGLAVTTQNLAVLALRQKQYAHALQLIETVLASSNTRLSAFPRYWPLQVRGEAILGLGKQPEALRALAEAVEQADVWRQGALPGDDTNTRTQVEVHDLYHEYVQLGAELSLLHHQPALAQTAFNKLAESRASTLRDQMLAAMGHEMRLPPRYYELLTELQTAQARVTLGKNPGDIQANNVKLQQIRVQLADLQNKIGISQKSFSEKEEKGSHKNSLRDIQLSLSRSELLLSFCLDKDRSFLWAVTGDQVNLYQLPSEDQIAAGVNAFTAAVQRNGSARSEGLVLSRKLFSMLDASARQRKDWLIVGDGVLLNSVPFSALPDPAAPQTVLTSNHTLRFLPSELLIAQSKSGAPRGGFVGVGDPIYNFADSRRARPYSLFFTSRSGDASLTLARLVGSDREVRAAAKFSGFSTVQILTGADASGEKLRAALAARPEVVHFAVHVVSPESPSSSDGRSSEEAALALSLKDGSLPELLTKEDIAALRVPGSLVVLSGCASQQGENLPGAGLIGLSRAWLLAGASAVIVSAWPTPDDSGRFFSTFYSHLQATGERGNLAARAAAALQETQLEMQHSSGYRNLPSFWAAYSLISKE